MANCPGCGGLLKFSIYDQQLKCMSCSALYSPYEKNVLARPDEHSGSEPPAEGDDTYEATVFTCPQCGGVLTSTDHDLSGNCTFCGSPVVFESKLEKQKKPDYIIPFGISKKQCKNAYMKYVKNNPYTPEKLKDPEFIDGFRGIYVPYWIYDVRQEGSFTRKGDRTEVHGEYTYQFKDEVTGTNCSVFKHIMHDASSVFHDDLSEKTEPFETVRNPGFHRRSPEFREFSEGYFAGFYAEPADVPSSTYEEYARNVAEDRAQKYIETHSKLSTYNITLKKEEFGTRINSVKLAMMPVWFLSYRKGNRVAYAAVNGQTGRVVSDTPIDTKVFLIRFLIAAVIAFVLLMFTTILPVSVTLISVIMAMLVTGYCAEDTAALKNRSSDGIAGRLRDNLVNGISLVVFFVIIGVIAVFKILCLIEPDFVTFVNASSFSVIAVVINIIHLILLVCLFSDLQSVKKKDKSVSLYLCPLINMASGIAGNIVLAAKPVWDYCYYAVGVTVLAAELVSFLLLIRNYNRIATRPLPQFSVHKGGDDSAV